MRAILAVMNMTLRACFCIIVSLVLGCSGPEIQRKVTPAEEAGPPVAEVEEREVAEDDWDDEDEEPRELGGFEPDELDAALLATSPDWSKESHRCHEATLQNAVEQHAESTLGH